MQFGFFFLPFRIILGLFLTGFQLHLVRGLGRSTPTPSCLEPELKAFFSFSTLMFHFLVTSIISDEKSVIFQVTVCLDWICHFFSGYFPDSFSSQQFCLGVAFFLLILLGVSWTSWFRSSFRKYRTFLPMTS